MSGKITGEEALKNLVEGNLRFAYDHSLYPRNWGMKRQKLFKGQTPFAVIVGCSDSRVCPEIIFDANLGDLFVIRTAGHVMDGSVLGSMQFAVKHLKVPLIVVLGHSGCGAVEAAINRAKEVQSLKKLIKSIHHSIKSYLREKRPDMDQVIEEHTKHDAEDLKKRWSFFLPYIQRGDLRVIAAHYEMSTGLVKFFDHKKQRHELPEGEREQVCGI